MKKIYVFIFLILGSVGVWGQQVIGSFSYMDGGFEGQAAGALANAISATSWTRENKTGASSTIITTTPRTGLQYARITNVASSVSRGLQSPQTTIPANGPQASTSYNIQYYIKNPSIASYTESINTNGTTNTAYGSAVTVAANATWTKRTVTQTSASTVVTTAGILVTARSISAVTFDIDDVVLYAGAVDNTAPSAPGAVTVNNPTNNTLDVSWGTASGGVDGGGYVVVRYAESPGATDNPNQNGIYAVGNTVTVTVNGTVAYIGTATSFTDAGLSSTTTYYYKVYTVDKAFNYSGGTEANGTTAAFPLPITINYFNGTKQGINHLLNWKVTCTNTSSAIMTLERSADSRNFISINSITADAVRCNQPFSYTDVNPIKGMNYYRLKLVDADGKISYSSIVALLNAVKGFDIVSIAPNPVVTDNFKLNIACAQGSKIEVSIYDMQGRLVNRQSLNLIAGFNSLPFNVASLSSGSYTIRGSINDDKTRVMRFVKE